MEAISVPTKTAKPDYYLKRLREEKNWTQEEAAEHTGISRSYYAMVEVGRRKPSIQAAQKLEKAFKIDWHAWFDQAAAKTRTEPGTKTNDAEMQICFDIE